MAAGSEEEESCSRIFGKWRCKNASADNEQRYCQKHYKNYKDLEMERMKLPPDEQRCRRNNGITHGEIGSWRCKDFRLSNGTKTSNYCEKHHIYHANRPKKPPNNESGGIQPHISNTVIETGSADTQGSGELDFLTVNELKKKKEMEKIKLPPDEQRCSQANGTGWRCKNFRMGLDEDENSVPKSKHCEKHYNLRVKYEQMLKKKTSGDADQDAGSGPIEETSGSKKRRKKKVPVEEADTSVTIVEGASAKTGAKRKKIETTSGELKYFTGMNEPVVELGSLDHFKTKCFQVSLELELAEKELEHAKIKLELARDEDETEYWRNKCSDLETLVLPLETENFTTRYEDSSILRCQELRNSEIIGTGDNVEEWEDWDFLEETPSQHGSSSQAYDLEHGLRIG